MVAISGQKIRQKRGDEMSAVSRKILLDILTFICLHGTRAEIRNVEMHSRVRQISRSKHAISRNFYAFDETILGELLDIANCAKILVLRASHSLSAKSCDVRLEPQISLSAAACYPTLCLLVIPTACACARARRAS